MSLLRLAAIPFAITLSSAAFADPVGAVGPVGTYSLTGQTFTSGVHMSFDFATISGTVTYNPQSILTAADITLFDTTTGNSYTFTKPGGTEFIHQYGIQNSWVLNAADPTIAIFVDLAQFPNADGSYTYLTCGTDCHPWAQIPSLGGTQDDYLEYYGRLAPVPEPSALALVGSGVLGAFATLRRRLR